MPITGPFPETGVRIDLERPREQGPPFAYQGRVVTPTGEFAVTAILSLEGAVTIDLAPGAPADAADRARLLLRAAWKHAQAEGAPPPRRIVRWRSER